MIKTITLLALFSLSCFAEELQKDQERTIVVSNITYTIRYKLKSTEFFSQPLTSPLGQPHYDCTATMFRGTNQIGILETQWTKDGCFEDSPMLLIGRTLNWKRFPNDSAGKGMHWVISGPAMWAESDDKL